jgi:hypothetical protein
VLHPFPAANQSGLPFNVNFINVAKTAGAAFSPDHGDDGVRIAFSNPLHKPSAEIEKFKTPFLPLIGQSSSSAQEAIAGQS